MPSSIDLGRELRIASGLEIRRADDTNPVVEFRGYASVFNVAYDVAGGPDMGGWTEEIVPGAFKRSIGDGSNRALLYHHDNSRVLATTRAGDLSFAEDKVGLLVGAQLDTRISWIKDLVLQIESGTVDEMSIGFYDNSGPGAWSRDYTHRTISAVRLIEATITWAGANGATVAAIERSRSTIAEARAASPALDRDRIRLAASAASATR